MDASRGREISERDQLWASLRALRPEIERLADGDLNYDDERQRQIIAILARIVAAEMEFRERDTAPE